MIRKFIQGFVIASLTVFGMASCNKDIEGKKVINVTFHGYNISDTELEVSVDTVVFDKKMLRPNGQIGFSMVYPYIYGKTEAIVRVKDKANGKELFQQKLDLTSGRLEFFNTLINIKGNVLEVKPPAADPATNKLGFYIYYPESDDPIDIFMTNQNTGETVYLAKSVKPQTWVYVDYLPAEGFQDKNIVGGCTIFFTKAGTTDQWAFNDDEYVSQTSAFSWSLPHARFNLNKVQPYFILPSPQGWEAEAVRLFPIPKEY